MNESKRYDCSRGCTVERGDNGEIDCNYRQGCCKLEVYDWLDGVNQEQFNEFFEVRFKNTRKGIYRNGSGQSVKTGDLVIVEVPPLRCSSTSMWCLRSTIPNAGI